MVGPPTAMSLVSGELLSRFVELLARQGPAPEPLRDDPDVRAVHPLATWGLPSSLTITAASYWPIICRYCSWDTVG